MVSSIWISIPITDVQRATAFYTALGFTLNPTFSDDNGSCIELGDNHYFMLVRRDFLATMTDKTIVDPHEAVQVGINITRESREDVDAIVERGLAAGGTEPREAQDLGFMYSRDLDDPDGNNVGFLWMAPQSAEQGAEGAPAGSGASA